MLHPNGLIAFVRERGDSVAETQIMGDVNATF